MSQSHEDPGVPLGALSIQANDPPESAVSAIPDHNATSSRHLPGLDNGATVDLDKNLRVPDDSQGILDENAGLQIHPQHYSEGSTTFMTLPIEIRGMIMQSLFGGRKIHVCFREAKSSQIESLRSDNDWVQHEPRYLFCQDDHGWNDAHRRRSVSMHRTAQPSRLLDPLLFSILTVCKQLSKQGLETFYKTNTFSFEDPTSFNIFISRLSSARSSILRKIELIAEDDNDALGTLIARGPLAAPPYFWSLGGNDLNILPKLASITNVDIVVYFNDLCDQGSDRDFVTAYRVSHIKRWLRYVFGGLHVVRSLRRMELYIQCQQHGPVFFTREKRWGDHRLDQATLDTIVDEFTREILDHQR